MARINFQLSDVPSEFGVNLFPSLLAEEINGSRTGVTLTTTESLMIKEIGSDDTNFDGQVVVQRTDFFISDTLFEDLQLNAVFTRLATQKDEPFFSVGSLITVGSNTIPCDNVVSFPVNWLLN